jgi:short subunit dehydrogenase-like uncharacterized protein
MKRRNYDIVLYGATGFVGSRAAQYLAVHPQRNAFTWAIAGRDRTKLEALQSELGGGKTAGVLVADSRDAAAVDAMAVQARVLINTAGPFALFGDAIVDACVRRKTHYVDITGETVWVRSLIDRHHERAAADGTRIIPCCGFDSVPSDLGSYLISREMRRTLGVPCRHVKAYFQMYGGFNGGTLASNILRHESGAVEIGRDPFLLNPADGHTRDEIERNRDPVGVSYDGDICTWVGPFIMGPINTRVVRRSAALFEQWKEPYGPDFEYQEYTKFDAPAAHIKASLVNGFLSGFEGAMARASTRGLLKKVLPKPGAGPSERTMASGWFTTELLGFAADGRVVRGVIRHQGDPGNRATLKFVCEAGLCLALDADGLPGEPARGGVLTPATGLGDVLVERLRAADVTLEVGMSADVETRVQRAA